jgi:hypothetical protein
VGPLTFATSEIGETTLEFSGRLMRVLASLVSALTLLISWNGAGRASEIGIVQYNVKGGQGGWMAANGVLDKQIDLIFNRIKKGGVDFVTLEQADERAGVPGPILSDRLEDKGLAGWRTIVSACNKDTTQIAFSSAWELTRGSGTTNPLLNGTDPQRGWIRNGCTGGDGRPYNMAHFRNKETGLMLLLVVVHFPHCDRRNIPGCVTGWELDRFHRDIESVTGKVQRQTTNLIAVGDMNELGEQGPNMFEPIFLGFGKLRISPNLATCCQIDGWVNMFDHILSNTSEVPTVEIVGAGYPLNPGYGAGNEEHKAICGWVKF